MKREGKTGKKMLYFLVLLQSKNILKLSKTPIHGNITWHILQLFFLNFHVKMQQLLIIRQEL